MEFINSLEKDLCKQKDLGSQRPKLVAVPVVYSPEEDMKVIRACMKDLETPAEKEHHLAAFKEKGRQKKTALKFPCKHCDSKQTRVVKSNVLSSKVWRRRLVLCADCQRQSVYVTEE